MTSVDPNEPEVLLSVANEIEAGAIVAALADYEIEAFTTGGYVSGFKVAAPADVAVLVKRADLDRAREALADIRQHHNDVDWSDADQPASDE
jgi:hypothetical protein